MHPAHENIRLMTRRHLLSATARGGIGAAALSSLGGTLPAIMPHHAPKAKRAIYLFMAGAPAQMDMFDYKPLMDQMFDKDLPDSVRQGQRLTTMTSKQERLPIAPSKYSFQQYGKGGAWMSELIPYHAKMADDIAIVKTLHTEAINHDPAITFIQTGRQIPAFPSLGSWLSYGLGSHNENLPTFVVMTPTWTGRKEAQALYNRLWSSGFLPSRHSGVQLRSQGDPVLYLSDAPGVSRKVRRTMLDSINRLNAKHYESFGDPEIQTRIANYEMAFKMQASVPELTDLSKESKATLDMYGPDVQTPGTFAYCALMARRMAERGVRFTQLFHRGWDQHAALPRDLPNNCRDMDQPCYALIQDLKQRGMLDDTLVVWGGEFGRTIYCQGKLTRDNYGRDHHPRCFSVWMAGAGVQGGVVHGETDDFSYNIVRDPVHIRDLNATILSQLGIDHERLTVKFQGLDARLTGVDQEAKVIDGILA
jgi:hypothetical protein